MTCVNIKKHFDNVSYLCVFNSSSLTLYSQEAKKFQKGLLKTYMRKSGPVK